LEKLCPAVCLVFSVLFLTPACGLGLSLQPARTFHIVSFLVLGLCFELPELSLNGYCLWKAGRAESSGGIPAVLKRIYFIRYMLTHYVGPCSGLLAVASGLYLVYGGGYSFQDGWLFWILMAAIIGLYKGLTQHNAYIKILWMYAREMTTEQEYKVFQRWMQSPFDQALIFTEFPTYIFIYWAASAKPGWLINPWAGWIGRMETAVYSPALWGVIMVAAGSVLILPFRYLMRCYSRVQTGGR
jgi:hypothetical protein